MNFGFDGADLTKLIKKYEVSQDMLVVYFLDNKSSVVVPYCEDFEQMLQDSMIMQAELRQENTNINRYKDNRHIATSFSLFGSSFTILPTIGLITSEQLKAQIFAGELIFMAGTTTALSMLIAIKQHKKISELKKYDIYLSIREEMENVSNKSLYEGVASNRNPLNINTLDSYSLKELKTIRDNLKKLMSNSNVKDKTLIKNKNN